MEKLIRCIEMCQLLALAIEPLGQRENRSSGPHGSNLMHEAESACWGAIFMSETLIEQPR